MLDTNDTELVINDTNKSQWMWVASPNALGDTWMMYVENNGNIGARTPAGFRPIVCLSSGVQLESTADGYAIK